MRIGSLFSGAGGLDMAVEQAFGDSSCSFCGSTATMCSSINCPRPNDPPRLAQVAWHCEVDRAAARVLAAHWPLVPNFGDITTVNWSVVEPVDVLCAGWPCQPFSVAGKQKGVDDERALWPEVARAVRALRPSLVVLENVPNIVVLGELARAVGDLAANGYDAQWVSVRASDIGAPHQREREFILAADADNPRRVEQCRAIAAPPELPTAQHASHAAAELVLLPTPQARDAAGAKLPEDTRSNRRDPGRGEAMNLNDYAVHRIGPEWGQYAGAIHRWEAVTRPAPKPTEPARNGSRLAPTFSEWLMGWPLGHVTQVDGISRNDQLRIIGNGVVPQQAEAAIRRLLNISEAAA